MNILSRLRKDKKKMDVPSLSRLTFRHTVHEKSGLGGKFFYVHRGKGLIF